MMDKRFVPLTVVNLLFFIGLLTINSLSNSLPLNGKTPGQLSDLYPNLFVPAGLTFAIWGVIYLVMLVWIIGQTIGLFSQKQRQNAAPSVEHTGWLYVLTCVFNVAWLFAWHWEKIPLSLVFMLSLLATLIVLNEKTQNGRSKLNNFEKNTAHTLFGLYQGWITVATIANVTALLVASGWGGFGLSQEFWAITMVVIGAGLAVYMTLSRNMIFHGVAVVWALLGIFIKRNALGDAEMVKYTALAGMVAVLIAIALRLKKWWSY